MSRQRHSTILSALGLALLLAAWALFAPIPLGGQAAYVIVDGNSMEPGMHRGDLVILRRADDYAVGQVVTYRHPSIGPVIHRIIGREGERYLFQGDNNAWLDSYRPTRAELIGRLWFHLPGLGKLLEAARRPSGAALLTAVLLGSVLMTGTELPRAARRSRAAPPAEARADAGAWLGAALTGALILGLLSLAVAALAFASPATKTVAVSVPFTHVGRFAYSAEAPGGLYDGGQAATGDPIFRRVTDEVRVQFSYELDALLPAAAEGTARLRAELSDGEGWRRSIELAGPVAFRGATAAVSGTLRLDDAQALIDRYEALTGVTRPQYLIALVPEVELRGTLGGAALDERFAPRVEFRLEPSRLQPLGAGDAFTPQQAGSLSSSAEEPATLGLWLVRPEVVAARRLSLVGLEVALAAGLLLGWRASRVLGQGEDAAIRLRYRSLIVSALAAGPWAEGAAELSTIEDLARVAERAGLAMVWVEGAGYYVRDGASVYCYRGGGARSGAVAAPAAEVEP